MLTVGRVSPAAPKPRRRRGPALFVCIGWRRRDGERLRRDCPAPREAGRGGRSWRVDPTREGACAPQVPVVLCSRRPVGSQRAGALACRTIRPGRGFQQVGVRGRLSSSTRQRRIRVRACDRNRSRVPCWPIRSDRRTGAGSSTTAQFEDAPSQKRGRARVPSVSRRGRARSRPTPPSAGRRARTLPYDLSRAPAHARSFVAPRPSSTPAGTSRCRVPPAHRRSHRPWQAHATPLHAHRHRPARAAPSATPPGRSMFARDRHAPRHTSGPRRPQIEMPRAPWESPFSSLSEGARAPVQSIPTRPVLAARRWAIAVERRHGANASA
jgi:hypothetical protein